MGVYFSIAHSNDHIGESNRIYTPINHGDIDSGISEKNRNIRSKTAMLFKFTEENKYDSQNGNNATFLPLSFIEFVQKRPVSFASTPIVVIEGVPQGMQSMTRRSRKQNQQPRELIIDEQTNENTNNTSTNIINEIIPDLPQKYSYKSLNRELHQNFEISQYKVNATRIWILRSNSIREKVMTRVVECCRHFDFASFISNQYVRVENIFSDVKSNDFQSLASALRPQEFASPSTSPPNQKKSSKDTGNNNLKYSLDLKSDGAGGLMDFSKTAPLSIPKYLSKSEKQKMLNLQINTSNVEPPKTQETPNHQQTVKLPNLALLSTSPTTNKVGNLSENSSGNSSENLSENLSENSPDILSENSSELLLRNSNQIDNTFSSPEKSNTISLLPLRIPALTPERTCFSSRRPCEINCDNNFNNGVEISQFANDDEFINYTCSSEDARIKFRYRNSNECDMVIPGLFIGGEKAAHDKKLLRKLKITHIVNLNFNESGNCQDGEGKDLYDDDSIDDDLTSNESSSSIINSTKNPDSDFNTPLKSDHSNPNLLQQKSKRQILNQSPRSKQFYASPNQNQQGKVISPRSSELHSQKTEHENDNNNNAYKQKDSNGNEIESQSSASGSFKLTKISRFNVRLSDSVFQDLNDDFWGALRFVEQAIHSGGNVLAHCRRGISRSAALCVAYLMDDRGMTFDDAFALLKRQRPSVNINQGFEDQLRAFSSTIKGKAKEEINS